MDFHDCSDALEPTIYALARALAKGCKSAFLIGPPGTGKTMIARRISTIMRPLTEAQIERVREVYALLNMSYDPPTSIAQAMGSRPFRAPHHTISQAAMIGAPARAEQTTPNGHTIVPARNRRPGEVELASHGVLVLDELIEFPRAVLEATASKLRDLGDAAPYVIAETNPCFCGWIDSGVRECMCSAASVKGYKARLVRALETLRIDQQLVVPSVGLDRMRNGLRCAASATIARHVGLTS